MEIGKEELLGALESTLLKPTATEGEVEALVDEAVGLGFFGVCVAPSRVMTAKRAARGGALKVVTVAAFPLGFETARAKAAEIADAVECGADEVDVVLNLGNIVDEAWHKMESEVRTLREAAGPVILKIILETGSLNPEQLARAAEICVWEGADFLKTSTGLGPRGASVEDVHFLKKASAGHAGIKAAGGIRTLADAIAMLQAGADRIGTSAAGAIWREFNR